MTTAPLTIVAEFRVSAENRARFLELCAYDSPRAVEAGKRGPRVAGGSPPPQPQPL
ncbi:MAG: antibiotic biosynthesis monooxygenase, partial [Komagataeibacter saccharivorans]